MVSSRRAVATAFLLHGVMAGTFAARIPAIQERLDLSPGRLGLALLMIGAGCVTTMHAGVLLGDRIGRRNVLLGGFLVWAISLPFAGLVPGFGWLLLVMYVGGVMGGNVDVAMNSLGVFVERAAGRSVMAGLHGLWSVGGIVGAGVAAIAAHMGISPAAHFALAGLTVAVIAVFTRKDWPARVTSSGAGHLTWPGRRVIVVGAIAFIAVLAEASGQDWSGVFLRDQTASSQAVAALGPLMVAASMAIGRLLGDTVVVRIGSSATVRIGGLVAVGGAAVTIVAQSPAVGLLGFWLLGFGVSVVVPLAFAAAGRMGDDPGHHIAAVATLGYGAGMAAPAIVGTIAEFSSIRAGFGAIGILAFMIVLLAGRLDAAV